jgi:hypothetical protein
MSLLIAASVLGVAALFATLSDFLVKKTVLTFKIKKNEYKITYSVKRKRPHGIDKKPALESGVEKGGAVPGDPGDLVADSPFRITKIHGE